MTRKKLLVMIIEPNQLQCDLITLTLARNSIQPIVCEDPTEIRQMLLQHKPDLLLVDTHLPGQNGLDLVSELNAEAYLKKMKVFIISSLGYPEIVQKAINAGATDFLVKPLAPDLLVDRIQRYFGKPVQEH